MDYSRTGRFRWGKETQEEWISLYQVLYLESSKDTFAKFTQPSPTPRGQRPHTQHITIMYCRPTASAPAKIVAATMELPAVQRVAQSGNISRMSASRSQLPSYQHAETVSPARP